MSEFVILIPPTFEAVSLAEVRAYLRIGTDADNGTLSILLNAAKQNVEMRNRKALTKRKLRQSFTSEDVERAFAEAKKMGGAPYLRPAFTPSSITEIRTVAADGNSSVANGIVTIDGKKFILTSFVHALEIDYFAGCETLEEVPSDLKLNVFEEVSRLIAVRDNEKSVGSIAMVRL